MVDEHGMWLIRVDLSSNSEKNIFQIKQQNILKK